MEAQVGITGPQRLVIQIVARFPGISAGELAHVLHVHPSTLTGILTRLERRKLVKRTADPKDGRRALLELTPAGRQFTQPKTGKVQTAVARTMARLSSAQMSAAQKVLEVLADELEK